MGVASIIFVSRNINHGSLCNLPILLLHDMRIAVYCEIWVQCRGGDSLKHYLLRYAVMLLPLFFSQSNEICTLLFATIADVVGRLMGVTIYIHRRPLFACFWTFLSLVETHVGCCLIAYVSVRYASTSMGYI